MLHDIVVQLLEEVVKLARQERSWEFPVRLSDQVFESENVEDPDPYILLAPTNHSATNILQTFFLKSKKSFLNHLKVFPLAL